MKLRDLFWIGLVIWWGGALVGQLSGIGIIHAISVNIFGLLTIALGVFLIGRLLWRRLSGPKAQGGTIDPTIGKAFGQGMGIYSTFNVPEEARDPIERAVQADAFKPKGKMRDGAELLHVQTPTQDYLVIVEVTDAILVRAAYTVTADTLDQRVEGLLTA